jgi:hypothetical protein
MPVELARVGKKAGVPVTRVDLLRRGPSVDKAYKHAFGRRDLFRAVAAVGAAAAVTTAASTGAADPPPKSDRGKRKSQYQANAPEVRAFYRVNSYPTK